MILHIGLFLLLNFGALAIGTYFMNNGPTSSWYISLNKAPWSPPGWFFGIAWTTIMICFSIYLSFLIDQKSRNFFWTLFFIQFVLNVAWNYIFFNKQQIGIALIEIIFLTIVIGYYLFKYGECLGIKSWFVVPYFVWLLVATSLNGYIYFKN